MRRSPPLALWALLLLSRHGLAVPSDVVSIEAGEAGEDLDLASLYVRTVLRSLTGDHGFTPELDNASYDERRRHAGKGGCIFCLSVGGTARLESFGRLLLETWRQGIPGDFLDAGTWRGAAGIYAAALAFAYPELVDPVGDDPEDWSQARQILLADNFGESAMARPRKSIASNPTSSGDPIVADAEATRAGVEDSFERYALLSPRIHFLEGDFRWTLPQVRREYELRGRSLSMLRLDTHAYESNMDVLYNLYDALSIGGYVFCDKCRCDPEADRSLLGFRQHHRISSELMRVAGSDCGLFFRKEEPAVTDIAAYDAWVAAREGTCDAPAADLTLSAEDSRACELRRLLEASALMRLETVVAASLEDVHQICVGAASLVVLWSVPRYSALHLLSEVEVQALLTVQEALQPMSRYQCAQLVLLEKDIGDEMDGLDAIHWRGARGSFMALNAICGQGAQGAAEVLRYLASAASSTAPEVHAASSPGILRAWLSDAAACPPWTSE